MQEQTANSPKKSQARQGIALQYFIEALKMLRRLQVACEKRRMTGFQLGGSRRVAVPLASNDAGPDPHLLIYSIVIGQN